MASSDDSMENFLTEIEEYSKRLEDEKKSRAPEESNSDEEFDEVSDNPIDNLYESREEIKVLKEVLEAERKKVKSLEDIIKKQKKDLDMLTEKKDEIEQPKINKGYTTNNKRC